MSVAELRKGYHHRICEQIIRIKRDKKGDVEYPNFADGSNRSSTRIAWGIVRRLGCALNHGTVKEQTAGDLFEAITKDFLERMFELLQHLRPGQWRYSTKTAISAFHQYEHLAYLESVVKRDKALSSALGGNYIVKPDVVIGRWPVSDKEINRPRRLIGKRDPIAKLTPLRAANHKGPHPILHASISCKWTIRSDRSQNTRTEALNLIRNRKGHLPHVVAVTAEPLPTRVATLALGTGDLDCVYHFALPELREAIEEADNQDQLDILLMMIEGRRLRDISDLPFDLAT
jgi:hypothetical protein